MPGLSIPIGGGRMLGGASFPATAPATIAQTAYGAGATEPQRNAIETGHVVMGAGVASLAFLVFLRHSLPREQRSDFDLVMVMAIPGLILYGAAGVWARRRLRYDRAEGLPHGAALFVKTVTP